MNAPLRRGFCPGLSAPMQTGDGLLVRLLPIGTIAPATFAGLAAAARACGSGIVEVTARGSIQVRGLTRASAPRFADEIAALGIALEDGIPILTNPLAGLAAHEILDTAPLAAELRRTVADDGLARRLAPKVSVTIDGGGALDLDELAADVRLRSEPIDGDVALRVSVGGDAASATRLGLVAAGAGVQAAKRLLQVIAQHGRNARARDIVTAEGVRVLRSAISDLLIGDQRLNAGRRPSEAVGRHLLLDGSFAYGIGLAFGHADASILEYLTQNTAPEFGVSGLCAAAGRVLMMIGLGEDAACAFAGEAERLGFIVRPHDPRRYVTACAGAPVCASAHLATRAVAPRLAADHGRRLGGAFTIHVSGCAKGCAHPAPAALTIVGTSDGCSLIADGSAREAPFAVVGNDQLPAAIATYVDALTGEDRHV